MLPSEYVESFKYEGASGTMINITELANVPLNNIVIATGIPRPIFMGEVAGVQTGSEVNERSYFAVLDQDQQALVTMVREFIAADPVAQSIIGDLDWKIDWGLRQVMTVQAKATLRKLRS